MNLPQLTFSRFVAAFLIVVYHLTARVAAQPTLPGAYVSKLPVMVSYFFLLSGFILVLSNAQNGTLPNCISWRQFWVNRLARVYPLYLFVFMLTLPLGLYQHIVTGYTLPAGVLELTALHAWTLNWLPSLNYPSWSISVEVFFYLFFPWLFRLLVNRSTVQIAVVGVGFWLISQCVYVLMDQAHLPHHFIMYLPLLHLNTFVCGVCTGILTIRYWDELHQKRLAVTWLLVVVLAVVLYQMRERESLIRYYHDGLLNPVFILLILFLASQRGRVARLLSHPRLLYLGEISYGIYLLQVPVGIMLAYLNQYLLHLPPAPYSFVYVLFLLLSAAFCYERIEKPARRSIRFWFSSRIAIAPEPTISQAASNA